MNKGDLVRLKSGSPVMTVSNADDTQYTECTWHEITGFYSRVFPVETLEMIDPELMKTPTIKSP